MIATIYENLATLVGDALSEYQRVSYSYDNTQISDGLKEKAFAIGVLPGENTERLINCKESFRRSFKVTLYNKKIVRRQNFSDVESLEKSFLTDIDTLIVAIGNEPQLFGSCVNANFVGDSGVIVNEDDTLNSMKIEIDIDVEYFLSKS